MVRFLDIDVPPDLNVVAIPAEMIVYFVDDKKSVAVIKKIPPRSLGRGCGRVKRTRVRIPNMLPRGGFEIKHDGVVYRRRLDTAVLESGCGYIMFEGKRCFNYANGYVKLRRKNEIEWVPTRYAEPEAFLVIMYYGAGVHYPFSPDPPTEFRVLETNAISVKTNTVCCKLACVSHLAAWAPYPELKISFRTIHYLQESSLVRPEPVETYHHVVIKWEDLLKELRRTERLVSYTPEVHVLPEYAVSYFA